MKARDYSTVLGGESWYVGTNIYSPLCTKFARTEMFTIQDKRVYTVQYAMLLFLLEQV